MTKEIQETRQSFVYRCAEEMALTGAYPTLHAIEVSLRRQGFVDAHELLNRRRQREWLIKLCEQSDVANGAEGTDMVRPA
jgi:hypothetical protein